MPTDKKLIVALLVLAALGGAVVLQNKKQSADLEAHSLEGAAASLPKIAVSKEDAKKIDKVVITRSEKADGGPRETITLLKKGEEDWELESPAGAKANVSNVKSMLDDLERLEVKELIDPGKDAYAKYDLGDDQALHAVFHKGAEVALDAHFGEDGSRGQMTRIGGRDGVYAVKGYSSYLFNRDGKGWRDKAILKFEEKDVVKVSVQNEHGAFAFEKTGETWKARHGKKEADADLEGFDATKLDSAIKAYKALSAADFGDGKKPEEVGLATPKATLTFQLKDGTATHVIQVGDPTEGTNRWMKRNGSDQIWSISSWAADWATAAPEKFQKEAEKKDAPKP
ncbi:MAG: DUF4340 domain-containing protein [Deltaproteobacteria bacterium]|nr:DUF4340 domain-containing protein [Deltaproteobacteria bacterium]